MIHTTTVNQKEDGNPTPLIERKQCPTFSDNILAKFHHVMDVQNIFRTYLTTLPGKPWITMRAEEHVTGNM